MVQEIFWLFLIFLAAAIGTVPAIQNTTVRNMLYWLVLSPIALGLVSVFCLTGIR